MDRYFRHEKRPQWGEGRLVADEGDRLRVIFADGQERLLLKGKSGLLEISLDDVPADSPLRKERGKERKKRGEESPSALKSHLLIKSVRLAVRDAMSSAKKTGAYPDDSLADMSKGLSRITADYGRFLGTKGAGAKDASTAKARALHDELGLDGLFEELAGRLEDVESQEWAYARAYEDPVEAAGDLRRMLPLVIKAADLDDEEVEELEHLLNPEDRKVVEDEEDEEVAEE